MLLSLYSLALAVTVTMVASYEQYRYRLPNGSSVPNTRAMGHNLADGGGGKNVFGFDFMDIGSHEWNLALCQVDSDGDGQTNGQELGDPCCTWSQADYPRSHRTSGISHPGDPSSTADPALWKDLNCSEYRILAQRATSAAPPGSKSELFGLVQRSPGVPCRSSVDSRSLDAAALHVDVVGRDEVALAVHELVLGVVDADRVLTQAREDHRAESSGWDQQAARGAAHAETRVVVITVGERLAGDQQVVRLGLRAALARVVDELECTVASLRLVREHELERLAVILLAQPLEPFLVEAHFEPLHHERLVRARGSMC